MTDVIVSVAILVFYLAACLAWQLRQKQLDRNRARRQWRRQFMAYTVIADRRASNVVDLDTYSRKVDAA